MLREPSSIIVTLPGHWWTTGMHATSQGCTNCLCCNTVSQSDLLDNSPTSWSLLVASVQYPPFLFAFMLLWRSVPTQFVGSWMLSSMLSLNALMNCFWNHWSLCHRFSSVSSSGQGTQTFNHTHCCYVYSQKVSQAGLKPGLKMNEWLQCEMSTDDRKVYHHAFWNLNTWFWQDLGVSSKSHDTITQKIVIIMFSDFICVQTSKILHSA
jgi:hypothetical protein